MHPSNLGRLLLAALVCASLGGCSSASSEEVDEGSADAFSSDAIGGPPAAGHYVNVKEHVSVLIGPEAESRRFTFSQTNKAPSLNWVQGTVLKTDENGVTTIGIEGTTWRLATTATGIRIAGTGGSGPAILELERDDDALKGNYKVRDRAAVTVRIDASDDAGVAVTLRQGKTTLTGRLPWRTAMIATGSLDRCGAYDVAFLGDGQVAVWAPPQSPLPECPILTEGRR